MSRPKIEIDCTENQIVINQSEGAIPIESKSEVASYLRNVADKIDRGHQSDTPTKARSTGAQQA